MKASYILTYKKSELETESTEYYSKPVLSTKKFNVTDDLGIHGTHINKDSRIKIIIINDPDSPLFNLNIIIHEYPELFSLDVAIKDDDTNALNKLRQFDEMIYEKSDKYTIFKTYDDVSSYYCQKLYPLLDAFDRNIRKLLYNTYLICVGEGFSSQLPYSFCEGDNRLKKRGKSENPRRNDEANYFYAYDYSQLIDILFGTNCEAKESQWNLLFAEKTSFEVSQDIMEEIKLGRNTVAHCKLMTSNEYERMFELLIKCNKAFSEAIKYTYTTDLYNQIVTSHKELLNAIADCLKKIFDI